MKREREPHPLEVNMREIELEKAQQKFYVLFKDALKSKPTIITRDGEKAAVILSLDDYQNLPGVRLPPEAFAEKGQPFAETETLKPYDLPDT
jgi:Antitoxin Phd_YefM, type II toxin-antitoxin system